MIIMWFPRLRRGEASINIIATDFNPLKRQGGKKLRTVGSTHINTSTTND